VFDDTFAERHLPICRHHHFAITADTEHSG
jgi:hypothetical protein